jgi:hypothetical protein
VLCRDGDSSTLKTSNDEKSSGECIGEWPKCKPNGYIECARALREFSFLRDCTVLIFNDLDVLCRLHSVPMFSVMLEKNNEARQLTKLIGRVHAANGC